jgi:hypothetical protein
MKWQKFEVVRKLNPWIKPFVGTLDMHVNKKHGIWDEKQERQAFRDWVKNNLGHIAFRSPDSLLTRLNDEREIVLRSETVRDKNISICYPYLIRKVDYVLYHLGKAKPLSENFCLNSNQKLRDSIIWFQKKSLIRNIFVLDGVMTIGWKARTASGKMEQDLDVWLVPENFTL